MSKAPQEQAAVAALQMALNNISHSSPCRQMALARTKTEEALMWVENRIKEIEGGNKE